MSHPIFVIAKSAYMLVCIGYPSETSVQNEPQGAQSGDRYITFAASSLWSRSSNRNVPPPRERAPRVSHFYTSTIRERKVFYITSSGTHSTKKPRYNSH